MSTSDRSQSAKQEFTIPAGAGDRAPELLYLNPWNDPKKPMDRVNLFRIIPESALPAGASVEVDALKHGGDPSNDDDWIEAVDSADTDISQELSGTGYPGYRIAVKSGGVAGVRTLGVAWAAAR